MMDCSDNVVEIAGLCAITALGTSALVIDGSMAETIVIAVAAGIGAFVTHVYHIGGTRNDDKEEAE